MGLAVRVIPVLLARGHQLVKGERFNSWRSVGHIEQGMRIMQSRECDEIILLDISATPDGRGPDFAQIERVSANCFCPLTVGGGVRSLDDVRGLLRAGADKVSICTAALDLELLEEISEAIGRQAIVVSLDVRDGKVAANGGKVVEVSHYDLDPRYVAQKLERFGAGEILLTSCDREGTLQGYDLELIEQISGLVSIPVIAHGGCGSYEHMAEAILAGASAVAVGAFFQFCDATPKEASEYLQSVGIEGRV